MMKFIFLFLALAFFNSPALADGQSHTGDQNSGVVKVYFADLEATNVYVPRLDVFLNGQEYGYLENGLDLTAYVTAGKQIIEVKGGDDFRKTLNFNVSRGSTLYFLIENDSLVEVSEERYERAKKNPPPEKWTITEKVLFVAALPVLVPLSLVGYLFFGD